MQRITKNLFFFSNVFLCPCDKISYSKLSPLLAIAAYHHLGNDTITVRLILNNSGLFRSRAAFKCQAYLVKWEAEAQHFLITVEKLQVCNSKLET